MIDFLEENNLQVTRKIAEKLVTYRKELEKTESKETKVDNIVKEKIIELIGELDAALDAELKLKDIFSITPKRLSLEQLFNPQLLFQEDIFEKLPLIAKYDFSEA